MSSVLHRPNSRKTSNSPDASMLRKLVRDRNCHPVLRGILESLLHYVTQVLAKWTTRNWHLEKPGPDIVVERNIDWPDKGAGASIELTQIKTSCTIDKFPGKHSHPQTDPLPRRNAGAERTSELKPRRVTTFQLLQSKFIRSTPKPPITHQREVGTLSSCRGEADLSSEPNMFIKNQIRKEQGLKKGGSVKDIVAKFAMAEHREKGQNMLKKQPVKPRLIGRGIILSSLMERFESVATVCKPSDLKCSHESPSRRVKVTSNVKQRVAFHEKWHQQVAEQTDPKQKLHKQIKSKTVGMWFQGNKISKGQEERPEQNKEILARSESNLEEENNLKAEKMRQISDKHSTLSTESQSSVKHMKPEACDKDVKSWRSEEYGDIQTPAEETGITNMLKHGHLELLSFTSVTESMFPEPYRLLPKVEAQMKWHVGTIMTCSPVWSTCVESSPKLHPVESSEKTSEPAPVPDERSPQTDGLSTNTCCNSMENQAAEDGNLTKAKTVPKGPPRFLIPRVHRLNFHQLVADRTDSFPLLTSHPESINPPDASLLPLSETSMDACDTGRVTCPPIHTKEQISQTKTEEEEPEVKPQAKGEDAKDLTSVVIKDTNMPQSFRLSDEIANQAEFKGSKPSVLTSTKIHPEGHHQKGRPKYTTINYGDPSVKQTYKPKIIRFTDTFTF